MPIKFAAGLGLVGLALATVAAAAQSPATVPTAPAAASPELRQASDRLAEIVLPDSIVKGQVDRIVEATLAAMFASGSDLAGLEESHPGMRDALGAAMKPVVAASSLRVMPLQRADLSGLYQSRLTAGEANQAADFFASPMMVKFVASTRANMDFKNTVQSLLAEKDATTTDVRRDLRAAGAKSAVALSPAEQEVIATFMNGPIGQKLSALRAEKLSIDAKWANYADPQGDQELEALVVDTMISHIAQTDPELAAQMKIEMEKPEDASGQ